MKKIVIVCALSLLPMFALAKPGSKNVEVVSSVPVKPSLQRETYLAEGSGSGGNNCSAQLVAPAGLVIESLSFYAQASNQNVAMDTTHFDEYAGLSVTTNGQSGQFFFPAQNKVYPFRTPFSPVTWVTKYNNTMALRLYPDEGSVVSLGMELFNPADPLDTATIDTCTLWISGYLLGDTDTGLAP